MRWSHRPIWSRGKLVGGGVFEVDGVQLLFGPATLSTLSLFLSSGSKLVPRFPK
jgi:hypothetical protein